jgi:hypothetical protein
MFDNLKSDPVIQDAIACSKAFEAALDKGYSVRQYITLVYSATRWEMGRQMQRRGLYLEKKYLKRMVEQEKAFDDKILTESVYNTLRKI